ncbi:MAG: hypothetical protein ACK6DZ_24340, partial [Acidobacteriota bacterium]
MNRFVFILNEKLGPIGVLQAPKVGGDVGDGRMERELTTAQRIERWGEGRIFHRLGHIESVHVLEEFR